MSDKKGWGSSVLGLFVERDDKPAAADDAAGAGVPGNSGDAAPYSSAGTDGTPATMATPAAAADGSAAFVTDPPAAPGGQVDFAAVYAAAGIDAEEQAQVTKAAELLHALPAGSDPARQIVEASLKAFGVPVDRIIGAGEKEIRALDAYVAAGAGDTRKVLADSQQRIAQFEQEIQRIKQVMDQRVAEQQAVERACTDGKLAVARVLEFFGHAPAAATAAPATPDKSSERSA
jgi:hypothetical protein